MKDFDSFWSGMLTVNNIEKVADLLRRLLMGKRFTLVMSCQFFGFKPDVRTNLCLDSRGGINVSGIDTISIVDTSSINIYSTRLVDDKYDIDFENPYFYFEGEKVTITRRSPQGELTYRVYAVERE
ncbi:MAG: hypothetical protein WC822_00555 [Candidatus Paceibacterota bacterium]|jgi:hypothetical protein